MESNGISRMAFLARVRVPLIGLLLGASGVARAEASQKAPSKDTTAVSTSTNPIPAQKFAALGKDTLEQRVQELMDREEIEDVIHRYAICAGRGEGRLMAELFTEDGWVVAHFPNTARPKLDLRNRSEIAKAYSIMKWGMTIPMIHNCLISVSGDTANGICSIEVRRSENGQSIIGSGYYEDKFRRENGRWKFSSREATFFHMVPLQKGWASTPPVKP